MQAGPADTWLLDEASQASSDVVLLGLFTFAVMVLHYQDTQRAKHEHGFPESHT